MELDNEVQGKRELESLGESNGLDKSNEQDLQLRPPKKLKRWPAYFCPSLASQRTSFCLESLKREDIKSVCYRTVNVLYNKLITLLALLA